VTLSRRSFAKWLLATAAALLMPSCKREDEMPIGDLFLKEDWTLQDRQILRLEMNKIETAASLVSGWVGSGTDPHFKYFTAEQAKFTFVPLGYGSIVTTAAQNINNNTKTAISLGDFAQSLGADIIWDSASPTKIGLGGAIGGRTYAFCGDLWWANNSAGYRALYVDEYDKDDNRLWGKTIHQMPPASGKETAYSFSGTSTLKTVVSYMIFSAQQTSGGVLSLGSFRVHLWRVH